MDCSGLVTRAWNQYFVHENREALELKVEVFHWRSQFVGGMLSSFCRESDSVKGMEEMSFSNMELMNRDSHVSRQDHIDHS